MENLIKVIEEFNVFVFEFVDRKRSEEKQITFNGLYLTPNVIAIKRNQKYFKREIFTLMHEFAHCILNIEEIDDKTDLNLIENSKLYEIEQWCNDFAFYFIDDTNFEDNISCFNIATKENEFYKNELEEYSKNSFLSIYAYYLNLQKNEKISKEDCKLVLNDFEKRRLKKIDEIKLEIKNKENEKIKYELEKLGIFPTQENIKKYKKEYPKIVPSSKPIESNLYTKLAEINFSQGNYGELDLYNIIEESKR